MASFLIFDKKRILFNPIPDGSIWDCSRMVGGKSLPSLKSVTHPTMMKLDILIPYLKKIQKPYKSRDTFLEFCWQQHFFTGNQQFLLCIFLTYFASLKTSLINMVAILMMSAKLATPGPLKIKSFWNQGYDFITLS